MEGVGGRCFRTVGRVSAVSLFNGKTSPSVPTPHFPHQVTFLSDSVTEKPVEVGPFKRSQSPFKLEESHFPSI